MKKNSKKGKEKTKIGFVNNPSLFKVITSSNSSKVPQPPGKAITASAPSIIL